MPHLFTYLLFDGTCAEAMRCYERIFRGRIEVQTIVGESPMASQFPASSARRVIHACMTFDGNTLMASDWMAAEPYPGIRGVRLMLTYPDTQTASETFDALAEAGKVETPLQAMPFARLYGTLTDRFGVPWQLMVK